MLVIHDMGSHLKLLHHYKARLKVLNAQGRTQQARTLAKRISQYEQKEGE